MAIADPAQDPHRTGGAHASLAPAADEVRTLAELAALLRRLRRRDSRQRGDAERTYRELAVKTGWSHAAIGEYLTGRTLPPTDRLDILIGLLGATPTEQGAFGSARDRVEEEQRRSRTHGGGSTPSTHLADPPMQLPADIYGFTGRATELALLDRWLADGARSSRPVTCTVSGTAGVGKTALALHWAHAVAHRFPDGQLYVNLRGADPSDPAKGAAEAVRDLLDAFAVPQHRIPASLPAQAGLYRTLLASRKMLVVLDNAADAAQVRPLLPGAPGSLVLVTSRNQLAGLAAADGAHTLVLDVLPRDLARELLSARLAPGRVAAEPEAADEIVDLCARLPLALTIVAARAAFAPTRPLQVVAAQLRDAGRRLDPFSDSDSAVDIRAAFSWSYVALEPERAALFRLLSLHPGPDFTVPAAASLAGVPAAHAHTLITELTSAHLLAELVPGRYRFHDLMRAYAAELASSVDSAAERRQARHRMLDHHLQAAHTADRLLSPHRDRITIPPPLPGVTLELADSATAAESWLTSEHQNLLAAIEQAGRDDDDVPVWQFTWLLGEFLDRRARWHDLDTIQHIAWAAAVRREDRTGQAYASYGIGCADVRLGRLADAQQHMARAAALFQDTGDRVGEARTRLTFGFVLQMNGLPDDGQDQIEQALRLFRSCGHQTGQARALNGMGWILAQREQYDKALPFCQDALRKHQESGNRLQAEEAWEFLGLIHHRLHHYRQAVDCYQQAIQLSRELGDLYFEASALRDLADVHEANGESTAAREAWQRAVAITEGMDHPDADRIRAKLGVPMPSEGTAAR